MQITVNEPGARTIKDARPMRIDGHNVYVTLADGTASLIVAGQTVARREVDDISIAAAQAWAVGYRDGTADVKNGREEAARQVRESAAKLLEEASYLEAFGTEPYRHTLPNGRVVRFHSSDPRHPAQAAVTLRRRADVLAAWTAEDEAGYTQYVSDGVGSTDGYYAPLTRHAWKSLDA